MFKKEKGTGFGWILARVYQTKFGIKCYNVSMLHRRWLNKQLVKEGKKFLCVIILEILTAYSVHKYKNTQSVENICEIIITIRFIQHLVK